MPEDGAEPLKQLRAELDRLDAGDSTLLAEVAAYLRSYPRDFVEEISPLDRMYTHDEVTPYFPAGRQAVRSVRLAMLATERHGFESILDFGCGFGRVLRMLKAAFPEAKLTAADVRRDAVDFCATVLGAIPVYSSHDPAEIELDGSFDLIWCGSVFTHLSAEQWGVFLPFLESRLAPRGLLVITTLGRVASKRFSDPQARAGLPEEAAAQMLRDYERHGFGFSPYVRQPQQGVALSKPAWVFEQLERLTSLRLVTHHEAAWGQQDVVACMRGPFEP